MTEQGRYDRDTLELGRAPFDTGRLLLRPVVEGDVDAFLAMESDPVVMAHMPSHRVTDEKRDDYRAKMLAGIAEGTRYKFFLSIALTENPDVCIGWIFLRPTDDRREIEIGYRLLPAHWGKGIVPEALAVAFDMVFEDWQAEEVMAVVDDGNEKSDRVLEKLGFEPRGTKRMYGEELNYFVLTRDDWTAR